MMLTASGSGTKIGRPGAASQLSSKLLADTILNLALANSRTIGAEESLQIACWS